jgi:pyocin large subunit-like protein
LVSPVVAHGQEHGFEAGDGLAVQTAMVQYRSLTQHTVQRWWNVLERDSSHNSTIMDSMRGGEGKKGAISDFRLWKQRENIHHEEKKKTRRSRRRRRRALTV